MILGLLILSIGLQLLVAFLLIRSDTEKRRLTKRVDIKGLQLKERAIDMQMANTQEFIQQMGAQPAPEDEQEEDNARNPVGFQQ